MSSFAPRTFARLAAHLRRTTQPRGATALTHPQLVRRMFPRCGHERVGDILQSRARSDF